MKRDEDHAIQNARGWSQTITALVAALDANYERLQELRDEWDAEEDQTRKAELFDQIKEAREDMLIDGDEMKDAEAVRERIQESPLSVQIRSDWYTPGETPEPGEFEILLSTGGPALRIRGELDANKEPRRAWLEYQDWGTPWTEFHGEGAPSQDDLVTFASQFYFGE